MAIFGFIYFAMPNSLVPSLIFLGIMLSFVTHGILDGPQAASIAECFTPRLRYIAALDRLSSCLDYVRRTRALIATALLAWTGSGYAIACYIAACTAVSIIATMLMPDHTNQYISQEHARPR